MKGLAACAVATVLLPLLHGSALAEDKSKDELKRIFARQLDAIKAAETDPGLGRARGLVLNLIDPSAEADKGGATAEVVAQPTKLIPASKAATAPTAAAAPTVAEAPKPVPVLTLTAPTITAKAPEDVTPVVAETPPTAAVSTEPATTVVAEPADVPTSEGPVAVATPDTAPVAAEEAPTVAAAPVTDAVPTGPSIVEATDVQPAAPAGGAQKPALALAPETAPAAVVPAKAPAVAPQAVAAASQDQYWNLPKEDQVNVRITFGFDSAAIATDQKPKLREFCAIMDEMNIKLFRIVGHTDAAGTATYNQKLSVLRAEEVKRFFVKDCGIAPERLEAVGVGEQFLVNPKKPRDGENRRVEFQALS